MRFSICIVSLTATLLASSTVAAKTHVFPSLPVSSNIQTVAEAGPGGTVLRSIASIAAGPYPVSAEIRQGDTVRTRIEAPLGYSFRFNHSPEVAENRLSVFVRWTTGVADPLISGVRPSRVTFVGLTGPDPLILTDSNHVTEDGATVRFLMSFLVEETLTFTAIELEFDEGVSDPAMLQDYELDEGEINAAANPLLPGLENPLELVPASGEPFVRGDANGDGTVSLADATLILAYLFFQESIDCEHAADVDDLDSINLGDPVFLLNVLFLGGAPLASPFPACESDSTPGQLTCDLSLCP